MSRIMQNISQPKLLIGEGKDEVLFFEALLGHLNINDIQVEEYGGKQGLRNYLETLLVRPGYSQMVSLGITRDADSSVESAFQSICSSLASFSLPVPSKLGEPFGEELSVSIFILPDNSSLGMLEDICLRAFESGPIRQCIDNYFNCLKSQVNKEPKNISKARIHAWLAAQEDPDKRLGQAAKSGYLPWDSSAFDNLKTFLQNL